MALIVLALASSPAAGHDSRPLFIELVERREDRIELAATTPASIDPSIGPLVTLAADCAEVARSGAGTRLQKGSYACPIAGASLQIEWPSYNPSISTLVRVVHRNGVSRTAILDPAQTEWRVPKTESFAGVAGSYFRIGVEHIVGGMDHLLFLAGLLIISGTWRRAIVTVTGFTIAHSLTLALVALGLLRVSVPATEAVIALSIVFLAAEIARNDRSTVAWRRPILIAGVFGLAHGAGFAAALAEIGLPQTEKFAALLFFNLGVEAGQIAIVAAVFAMLPLPRRLIRNLSIAARIVAPSGNHGAARPDPRLRTDKRLVGRALPLAGYALGIVAAYWLFARVAALFA